MNQNFTLDHATARDCGHGSAAGQSTRWNSIPYFWADYTELRVADRVEGCRGEEVESRERWVVAASSSSNGAALSRREALGACTGEGRSLLLSGGGRGQGSEGTGGRAVVSL